MHVLCTMVIKPPHITNCVYTHELLVLSHDHDILRVTEIQSIPLGFEMETDLPEIAVNLLCGFNSMESCQAV